MSYKKFYGKNLGIGVMHISHFSVHLKCFKSAGLFCKLVIHLLLCGMEFTVQTIEPIAVL